MLKVESYSIQGLKEQVFLLGFMKEVFFGSWVRDFIFLPSAIIFLLSLLTGIYLTFFWLKRQFVVKHKRQLTFRHTQKANAESYL